MAQPSWIKDFWDAERLAGLRHDIVNQFDSDMAGLIFGADAGRKPATTTTSTQLVTGGRGGGKVDRQVTKVGRNLADALVDVMAILPPKPQSFRGADVILDEKLADPIGLDWSSCRSPSRAKRRHARGIKTRVRVIWKPRPDVYILPGGKLVMHPETFRRLEIAAKAPAAEAPASHPSFSGVVL